MNTYMANAPHFLPYGRHQIDQQDIDAVASVLGSDFLTSGPAVERFEAALAKKVGAKHAVACSSGTAALHLALMALDIGPGRSVLVPSITFLATANAARFLGAGVRFVDVDPSTGLSECKHFKEALSEMSGLAAALLPVHLGGQTANLSDISNLANRHSLPVIEDGSHALGSAYSGSRVGACRHSLMTTFSFHPVKTIAMGEGGAVTTNDDTLATRLRKLRNHGIVREAEEFQNRDLAFADGDCNGNANPWYYEMQGLGFNYRASDIQCALGESQLTKLEEFVEKRRLLSRLYDTEIARLAPFVRPVSRTDKCVPAWHLYQVLIDFRSLNISRAAFIRHLLGLGIGTQVHYIPVHLQPYYSNLYPDCRLAGALSFYESTLSLPLHVNMSSKDVGFVASCLGNLIVQSQTTLNSAGDNGQIHYI
ncbi:4-keto-6-deoxy-N-Acetyl-D-hexosaminyl-(Lipid carrier) aminotransferase [Rhodospirillaceae bacterium LM-1]|nr:4-keto-6-deoxy-N-Acetyl-D-hexosaminyl-(Lipid carrier) aminotransferase [Rhodospirillaceae bacterium LM-1]